MNELLESVQSLIDDCAAIGSATDAENLRFALLVLSQAAGERAEAIKCRLSGHIERALVLENRSSAKISSLRGLE